MKIKNKNAFHFTFFDKYIAGIILKGFEVKSIKSFNSSFNDAEIIIKKNECYLYGLHISQYKFDTISEINSTRVKKLLLNKFEIKKIQKQIKKHSYRLIPINLCVKKNLVKIIFGLAKKKLIKKN